MQGLEPESVSPSARSSELLLSAHTSDKEEQSTTGSRLKSGVLSSVRLGQGLSMNQAGDPVTMSQALRKEFPLRYKTLGSWAQGPA